MEQTGIDSSKWAAIYLIDEDRPFSRSGKTTIRRDVYIPKAGMQQAYIDCKAYQRDKRLIIGTRHLSEKKLPVLNEKRLGQLEQYFRQGASGDSTLLQGDFIRRSFLLPGRYVNFKKKAQTIKDVKISGNIILYSDTTIIIDSTAVLNNILVFAKSISVKSGFHGNCQLFATDPKVHCSPFYTN